MVRFYKRIQDQWFYKECWQDGDRVIFHHGVVGNEGKVDSEPCLDFSAYYNSFKRKYEKQGYSEFSPDLSLIHISEPTRPLYISFAVLGL